MRIPMIRVGTIWDMNGGSVLKSPKFCSRTCLLVVYAKLSFTAPCCASGPRAVCHVAH